ncbi:MAG TPA: alpha/beta fold hydrolase [Propionibacteriaceae bacterium]|nr:alpha/beta fold hydrolase [Propionibacteriaceae bacterium]
MSQHRLRAGQAGAGRARRPHRGRRDRPVHARRPPGLGRRGDAAGTGQSGTPMEAPWPLPAWPDVPTRFLLCRDDRLFPAEVLRQVVRNRLAITPDEIDGSHCVALSRPRELADRLERYLTDQ